MCGIAGLLRYTDSPSSDAAREGRLEAMKSFLRPRGPDQDGTWISADRRVQFVHTRLSILDLSDAGRQPFHSASGRTSIVFNGEIYNYVELATSLKAHGWTPRSGTDTEVLIELIEREGVQAVLPQLDGMFAFAVYNHANRTLTLARDPFGEKPLYFAQLRSSLVFSSDPRSIRAFGGSPLAIDHAALRDYLYLGYIPGSRSPWIGVEKLRPGTWLAFRDPGGERFELTVGRYFSIASRSTEVRRSHAEPLAAPQLDAVIGQVVKSRLIADVPVGALLSGGIDSSLISAHARLAGTHLSTFTIGFASSAYNEALYAWRVAKHLGTEHHEWCLTEREAQDNFDDLIGILGEPLGDSSLLPTYLVSKLAAKHVKVVLSGDGGDEMFGGYTRYLRLGNIRALQRLPAVMRKALATLLVERPDFAEWITSLQASRLPIPELLRFSDVAGKLAKLGTMLRTHDLSEAYRQLITERAERFCAPPESVREVAVGRRWLDDIMIHDTTNYLPDDICTKVDRASMACGLEVRAPFLSKRLFDEAWKFPRSELTRGHGKAPLRKVLAIHVPPVLTDRPKTGFGIPIHEWLRTGLRDRVVAATSDAASRHLLEAIGVDLVKLDQVKSDHLAGVADSGPALWNVLILVRWLEANA